MKQVIHTFLSTIIRQPDGSLKRETWERRYSPTIYENSSYESVAAMRKELRRRFGRHSTIEDIPNGVKITPNPGCSSGEAYQLVTLEED